VIGLFYIVVNGETFHDRIRICGEPWRSVSKRCELGRYELGACELDASRTHSWRQDYDLHDPGGRDAARTADRKTDEEGWNDQKDSMKPLYLPRSPGGRRCAGDERRRD
jgi:hypothetical protein